MCRVREGGECAGGGAGREPRHDSLQRPELKGPQVEGTPGAHHKAPAYAPSVGLVLLL